MKRLIIRLSSLGDVILAAAALPQSETDKSSNCFLTSESYAELFQGMKGLEVMTFQKSGAAKTSLVDLAAKISAQEFDLVVDLQSSMRTRILRLLIFIECFKNKKRRSEWKVYRKERVRRFLFVMLKDFCPIAWRPRPVHKIWANLAGVNSVQVPTLGHLKLKDLPQEIQEVPKSSTAPKMIAVMPASIWPAKEVNVETLVKIFKSIRATYIVMGTKNDQASSRLYEELKANNVPVINAIQMWPLTTLGAVLSKAHCYVGADTGLAHLSEAVGTPVVTVFGPTRKDFGFGPRLFESVAIETTLECSPCGKDGRYCFRISDRYLCQKVMPEKRLELSILKLLERSQ